MTTRSSSYSGVNLLNFLAYCAVIAVGVALAIAFLLSKVGGGNGTLTNALQVIANALAYIVTACYSWRWARTRGTAFIIVWVVAVVLIAVFMIWPLF